MKKKIEKRHSEAWFNRQEAQLREPFRNTKLYCCLPTFLFILIFFATKDYYHGWKQLLLSFLNISFAFRAELTWGYLLDVLLNLPLIALQIVALYYAVKSTVHIAMYRHYKRVALAQMSDYLGAARAITFVGAPGCGKTFSAGANFAVVVAMQRWEKLRHDYFMQCGMRARWLEEGNVEKLQAFKALEESYLFYALRAETNIPCLLSSIPIQDMYGRYSYILSDKVALQLERVPEYTVLFNDESGDTQGANTSKTASRDVLTFYRFPRHFIDAILLNTDQGGDGNGKYIRKSTDYNIRLRRQETVMQPNFGMKYLMKAKSRFEKRKSKGKYTPERERYLGEKLYYLEKRLETIGFRRIPYRHEASEGNLTEREEGIFIFPRIGSGIYYDRAYRSLYKALSLPLDLPAWTSMQVKKSDLGEYGSMIAS